MRGMGAVLCLAALSPFAVAQNIDKAKILQAIDLPALSASYGVNFRSAERDGKGNKIEPAQKIADLQKKLTGGPEDAEVYLEMRSIYLQSPQVIKDAFEKALKNAHEAVLNAANKEARDKALKDGQELFKKAEAEFKEAQESAVKNAQQMVTKAEATLRPHVNTTDPKMGYLAAVYGSVREFMEDSPWDECEKWARRAVSVAPQDWRTWAYLAHARHQQIPTILCGGDDKHLSKERRTQEVIGSLHMQRYRAENVDAAEKVLNEALQHHDKAKELAPNDPKRQEQRYGFRLAEIVLRNAICVHRGQKPAFRRMQMERDLLNELADSARLHPDHLLWQSQMAHQMIVLGWQVAAEKGNKDDKHFFPDRPEDLETIRKAEDNIEKIAAAAQGETAIFCYSMLAALDSSMLNHPGAEKHARSKILQLDPKNQMAAEQLQSASSSSRTARPRCCKRPRRWRQRFLAPATSSCSPRHSPATSREDLGVDSVPEGIGI